MRVIEKLLPLAGICANRPCICILVNEKTLCNVVIVFKYWNAIPAHHLLFLFLDVALSLDPHCIYLYADLITSRLIQDTVGTGYYLKYSLEDQHSGFLKKKKKETAVYQAMFRTACCSNR